MNRIGLLSLLLLSMLVMGCSRKGSSSLSDKGGSSYSGKQTPGVKSASSTSYEAQRAAQLAAEAASERAAREAAEAARDAAEKRAAEAEQKAREAAEQARQASEQAAKAAEAQRQAEIAMREEKVKVIESRATIAADQHWHIIIGSFKRLENARQLCQAAIANQLLPSVMENEEGMYRVAIFSSNTEAAARAKIQEVRRQFPEYVGVWLLKARD